MKSNEYQYVGKPRPLVEGDQKVIGSMNYVADLQIPGMLHARPVLSPHAHAQILSIDTSMAAEVPGVVAILTADDLPTRERKITSRNSAILAKDKVLWVGQPVVIVVAETDIAAEDAIDLVFVDYEILPAAVSLDDALSDEAHELWPNGLPQEGEDLADLHADTGDSEGDDESKLGRNIRESNVFERGDATAKLEEADLVITRTYRTMSVHQAYLEPHSSLAAPNPLGNGLTVYASTQGQFSVRREVARLLSLSESDVTVVPMMCGGGFGAKYGVIDPLAASVAMAVNRPVKLVLSRSEDFLSTTPAPECRIDLSVGASKAGKIVAIDAKIYVNNGVFSFSHGGIIAMLLGGYYKVDDVRIETFEINANTAPVGAYRAPGAPQATFALESTIEDIVAEMGFDPIEFRYNNAVEKGDMMGIGRPWPDAGLKQVLDAVREHPLWKNRKPGDGVGMAIGGWPTGVSPASAVIRLDNDGSVVLQTGHSDITGNNSSFVLIAAEVLGVKPEDVRVMQVNTNGPFSPGSGGSQVTFSVSGAVHKAAESTKVKIQKVAGDHFEAAPEDIELVNGYAQIRGVPDKKISLAEVAQKARSTRGGDGPIVTTESVAGPENAPAFTAHIVRVQVDGSTGDLAITDYVAIQDVGFAINPMLVEGQIVGGVVQGIGMTIRENYVHDSYGQLTSGSFMDYGMPRPDDLPNIEAILLDNPSEHGLYGMRGIGEPPLAPGPAAIANAIKDVAGIRLTTIPMTPESVWNALQANKE